MNDTKTLFWETFYFRYIRFPTCSLFLNLRIAAKKLGFVSNVARDYFIRTKIRDSLFNKKTGQLYISTSEYFARCK